jgi:hypothetical protein
MQALSGIALTLIGIGASVATLSVVPIVACVSASLVAAFVQYRAVIGTVAKTNTIATLEQDLAGRDTEIAQLKNRLGEQDEEIANLKSKFALYQDLLRRTLDATAGKKLGLGPEDRVSVYKHEGDAFQLLARCSRNPNFEGSKGRALYPANQGCISKAWANGEADLHNLPDPVAKSWAYEAEQQKCGIPLDVARGFRMKSRSYAAFTIRRLSNRKPRAVIVFESIDPTRMTVQTCKPVLQSQLGELLEHFFEVFEEFEPSIGLAGKEGY